MEQFILDSLGSISFGEMQSYRKMVVLPLFSDKKPVLDYLTMKEALESNRLIVSEISEGGSVPELKVSNKADKPVLLVDGEELVGAKQNRVLNSSILLKKKSETVIPVSCTEQGRWSYISEKFADSDLVASPVIRSKKSASVSESLNLSGEYKSDQGAVWNAINDFSESAGVRSKSDALRDVYTSYEKDIHKYLEAFECLPEQKGLLVFINGVVTGFDFLSQPPAYKILHPKLIKSYGMEALLKKKEKSKQAKKKDALDFIDRIQNCQQKKYKSVGHGWDYRFTAEKLVGSVLAYRKETVHAVFFTTVKSDQAGKMADSGRRRGFRNDDIVF